MTPTNCEQKALGKTIVLTTHNMHDAAELCDRVAFIVDGSLRALDTPRKLIMAKGAAVVRYSYFAYPMQAFNVPPMLSWITSVAA